MYVVLEIENHPDREVNEVFGPFEESGAAEYFAEGKYQSDENFNGPYNHRMYLYHVYPLRVLDN